MGNKLALALGTTAALAGMAQPAFASREIVAAQTLFACPEHTSGDRDFWGYGPETDVDLSLKTNGSSTALLVTLYMTQRETDGDHTAAEVNKTFTIATAPSNTRFTKVWLPDADGSYNWLSIRDSFTIDKASVDYMDNDRALDVFYPQDWWLKRVEIMGDTADNDVGYGCGNLPTDSHIKVFTEEVMLWYQ